MKDSSRYMSHLISTHTGVYKAGCNTPWTNRAMDSWDDILRLVTHPGITLKSDAVGNPPIIWVIGEHAFDLLCIRPQMREIEDLENRLSNTSEGSKKCKDISAAIEGIYSEIKNVMHNLHASLCKDSTEYELCIREESRGLDTAKLKIVTTTHDSSHTQYIDIVFEVFANYSGSEDSSLGILGDSDSLPDDDDELAVELNRRITEWISFTSKTVKNRGNSITEFVLPTHVSSNTGADLVDLTHSTASMEKSALVNDLFKDGTHTVESALVWNQNKKIPKKYWDDATYIVEFDARSRYLASAKSIMLGVGQPTLHKGEDNIIAYLTNHDLFKKLPFGMWEISLPSQKTFISHYFPFGKFSEHKHLWSLLPPVHPSVHHTKSTDNIWVTTYTLQFLQNYFGIVLPELNPTRALIWDKSEQKLNAWGKKIGSLVNDSSPPLQAFGKDIYRSYIGRISSSHLGFWGTRAHHQQPTWAWAIKAHSRERIWAHILHVLAHNPYRVPVSINTDSTVWALSQQEIDLVNDKTGYLGKFRVKDTIPIPEDLRRSLHTHSGISIYKKILKERPNP